MLRLLGVGLLAQLLTASSVRADDGAMTLTREGGFTPGILRAHAGDGLGFVSGAGGWNGAAKQGTLDFLGEAHLIGPLRAIVRVSSAFGGDLGTSAKPGAGLGVQVLDEERHGIAGSAYLLVKTEGFTEPEGEIEATVALGRHVGPLHLALDLTYGQDPDAKERDGEVAASVQIEPLPHLFTGITGRGRDALGSDGDKSGVVRDAFGGAMSTYVVGRVAVTAMAGVAGVKIHSAAMVVGPAATVAVGTVF